MTARSGNPEGRAMATTKKAQTLRLTSQYARGVQSADSTAMDAEGRDWYRFLASNSDEDIEPKMPECESCGLGVDWKHDSHWHGCFDDAFWGCWAHDNRQCVVLAYPKKEG